MQMDTVRINYVIVVLKVSYCPSASIPINLWTEVEGQHSFYLKTVT